MTGSREISSRGQQRANLNAEFRKAVAAEVAALCGDHKPTRRRSRPGEPLPEFGPYSGGHLSWPHMEELISNGLRDADSNEWLDTEEVHKVIYSGDRALPEDHHDRQVFLQVVQRVMKRVLMPRN